ncbi:MAG TPA: cytochrome C oxidase subunit IV family protein [Tepidisphaeraceae bacterium]|jgi:cytochrome c oxidase subunit 4|nr:cytochrome C oxidase subunit IV family protein [Tepidisphaeraceae bacterium]
MTHPTPKEYLNIFLILLALVAFTCALSFLDLDRLLPGHTHIWSTLVALLIAIAKAVLILLFFMHVKSAPRRVWIFAAAGFLWLSLLITLSLTDYLTRNLPPGSPKGEPHFLQQ